MIKSIVVFSSLGGMTRYIKDNFGKAKTGLIIYIISDSEVRLFSELDKQGNREIYVCASNYKFPEVKSSGLQAVLDIREYLEDEIKEYPGIKIIV